jgi:GNAT superfamily N-acetyltransferase
MNMDDYRIIERAPTVEELNRIRVGAGLSRKDPDAAEKGLANSLFCACVVHKGACVGIGRVVGDGGLVFDIVDVAVLPEHQGKGVGKRIMEALMAYVRTNAAPTAFVSLMTTANMVKFYEGYGFKVRDALNPGMYQIVPK